MKVRLTCYGDFMQFLKTPGATVQITRHSNASRSEYPDLYEPSKVYENKQRYVTFSNHLTLWLDPKRFEFDAMDETFVYDIGKDGLFDETIDFSCWLIAQPIIHAAHRVVGGKTYRQNGARS